MKAKTSLLSFNELSSHQLYQILKLRSEVFVVEQESIYLDPDGDDTRAWHVLVEGDQDGQEEMIGTLRLLKDGTQAKIGRVAVARNGRGSGLGKMMMLRGLHWCDEQPELQSVYLSAQLEQQSFYEKLGFVRQPGDAYDDGGIPHCDMVRKLRT